MKIEKESKVKTPANKEHLTGEEEPEVLEKIVIEELSIDGVCGVY
jgi:mycofactocin precursor